MESRDREGIAHSQRVGAFLIEIAGQLLVHVLPGLHLALTLGGQGKAFCLRLIMASVADGRSKTRTLADLVPPVNGCILGIGFECSRGKAAFESVTEVRRSQVTL